MREKQTVRGINFQCTGVHARYATNHCVVGCNGCTWANIKIRLQAVTLRIVLCPFPVLACKHTIRQTANGSMHKGIAPTSSGICARGVPTMCWGNL